MKEQLKRRNLSGIYIFDTFPGEEKRQPTCIEDCQQETRRTWCFGQTDKCLKETCKILADTYQELIEFLYTKECMTKEQHDELTKQHTGDITKYKTSFHGELLDLVDFFSEKIRLLSDACNVQSE